MSNELCDPKSMSDMIYHSYDNDHSVEDKSNNYVANLL